MSIGTRFETIWQRQSRARARAQAVSVAVSLFNYERFLEACLDSVLAQTHPHLELIIVDDNSQRDASVETARTWLERHADRFERALLIKHAHNRGLAAARNTAFAAARTDYVFVLDADNVIYPDALSRLHAAAAPRSLDGAYSQLEFFGDRRGIGDADIWSRRRLSMGPYIDAMALVRRRSWRQVGGYDHIEHGWEDYDFWCKMAEAGMSAVFVPEILCRYRVHGTSMTREHTASSLAQVIVSMSIRHPWLRLST